MKPELIQKIRQFLRCKMVREMFCGEDWDEAMVILRVTDQLGDEEAIAAMLAHLAQYEEM